MTNKIEVSVKNKEIKVSIECCKQIMIDLGTTYYIDDTNGMERRFLCQKCGTLLQIKQLELDDDETDFLLHEGEETKLHHPALVK